MPLTPIRSWRIPGARSTPDIPAHLAALAEDVELDLEEVAAHGAALTGRVDDLEANGSPGRAGRSAAEDVAFSIVDKNRRQSWLSVTRSGGIPAHSVQLLVAALRGALLGSSSLGVTATEGVGFVIADKSGRRSELEIGQDGRLTARVIASIAARLPDQGSPSASRYATKLACWGDSLTFSQSQDGQPDPSWPDLAGQLLGVPVFNGGKPAHGSADIATRQGGLRPLVTLEGNTIPTSGKVALTGISPADGWRATGSYTLEVAQGTLAGIPGKLTHELATSTRYFTRTTEGDPVYVAPGTPFIGTDGVGWRDAAVVIWAGTNNSSQTEAILRDIDSMVAWIAPYTDRYIILPLTTGTAVNASLKARYGNHFEDHRAHLIKNGLAEAGITPTEADITAMSKSLMPPSLTYDGTHFVQGGYDVIGRYIARRLKERGFFA